MATTRQRKAIAKIVETGGNITKAMREAGYSEGTVNNPKVLTESKGFKELADELGLTDDFLVKALVEDIAAKPKDRKGELELGFKIKGLITNKIEADFKGQMSVAMVEFIDADQPDKDTNT